MSFTAVRAPAPNQVRARTPEGDTEPANARLRLLLDHVAQALVAIDVDGVMSPERSAAFDAWFGVPRTTDLLAHLATHDAVFSTNLGVGLEMLRADALPVDVSLAQLPRLLRAHGHIYRATVEPVFRAGRAREDSASALDKLVVAFVDVTADLERERVEREQREAFKIYQRVVDDPTSLLDFADESLDLIAELQEPGTPLAVQLRHVHTLKGNASLFEFQSVTAIAHGIETRVLTEGTPLTREEVVTLRTRVYAIVEQVRSIVGQRAGRLDVAESDAAALVRAVAAGADATAVAAIVKRWRWQPLRPRFMQIALQAQALARRLGKGEIVVDVDVDDALRAPADPMRTFLSAFAHAMQNSIDHGLEFEDERADAGKGPPTITLRARAAGEVLHITLADDGRGIDWGRVAAKARARGLKWETEADLRQALFSEGFSTRDEASETSGRGIGLAVVGYAIDDLKGTIGLASTPGQGTTWQFTLPILKT